MGNQESSTSAMKKLNQKNNKYGSVMPLVYDKMMSPYLKSHQEDINFSKVHFKGNTQSF